MAKSEMAIKIGEAIRLARKQRGKVMRNISEFLDLDVAAIGNWESGRNMPSTSNLLKVAQYLQIDAAALGRGEVVFLGDELPADAEPISSLGLPPAGPTDVELLGTAVGGDDGDFTLNGEVTGYVRRPPGIAGLRKVFALHVLSTSMVPRYDPGELIYVGGRDPVPGDHVVIEMFPEENERAGKAFVKKLVERTTSTILVEQYNPPRQISFDRYAIKHLWRVIPTRELLGF
ncbi:repressor [Devosia sp. Leaf420]|uniref:XRE family transcriptional regulator n=1 Tax=Devosia sp. Leaf420 TaxID=1736374 RepID=UPI00071500F6|nr:helix-turn-helix transcriptional regulator [Devosia sp. Leaf420]KQT50314.1 repressor [Devosia sp. Leaf420]